jgi:hypothetical protein
VRHWEGVGDPAYLLREVEELKAIRRKWKKVRVGEPHAESDYHGVIGF